MKLLALDPYLEKRRGFYVWDDFFWYISPHLWTSLATGTGAGVAAGASAAGGTVVLTTGALANNEAAFATTNKPFKFQAEKPLVYEANVQYAEANTNTAGMLFGFSSVMNTTGMLADTTLLPNANFSGAVIFKTTGSTVWQFCTSVGGTQTITKSQHTAGGIAPQVLRIEVRNATGPGVTGLEAVPFLNGQQMLDANGKPIKHIIDGTSAVAMQAGGFAKTGSANSEVANVDYVAAGQLR